MKQAAAMGGVPLATVKAAKAAGCPAFRGSRVALNELATWLKANPGVAKAKDTTWRNKIDKERHRKFKMENDLREGELIERAWMASRIHVAAGKVDAFRVKSEAEHPLLFAAAAGDVPACRAVVQTIWNEVFAAMQSLEGEFQSTKKAKKEPHF